MTLRDDFILSMRLPTASAALSLAAEQAPAATSAPRGRGIPLCQHTFCDREATNGDLCEHHADLMADIRKEWDDLRAEFEDGWD